MNIVALFAISFFVSQAIYGQEKTDESKITLEAIFTAKEFKSESFSHPRFLEEGAHYTTLEKVKDQPVEEEDSKEKDEDKPEIKEIHWHDTVTGKSEILVSAAQLVPEGDEDPLSIEGYVLTDKRDRVLIFTNTEKVWRQNTRGDYWLLDLKEGGLKKLGGKEAPESSLMFATFSPDEKKIAYVRGNNIYVQDLTTFEITALTNDGSETIINGTFDWVNEEEFDLRNGLRWSPDSQSIAYWQFDQSGVPIFHMINNTDELYPRLIPIPYPKAGQTNSSVRVGVVSAKGGETRWIKVAGDPRQHYIADMGWVEATGELYLQQLNRLQNRLLVMLANPISGETTTIHRDEDEAWIDIEQDLRWTSDGKYYLTLSERDGWRHLYLVDKDLKTAPVLLTAGDYDVIQITGLDESLGYVYYIASPGDAIRRYLYRVKLDGSDNQRVTPAALKGENSYQISKDGKYAIHAYSTFDSPKVTRLVSLPDHTELSTLADNAELRIRMAKVDPVSVEFFRVDIGDGIELDGFCLKPSDFDPSKTYPVLFHVYGEPAGQVVRDRWSSRHMWHRMMAQRGTIVLAVDNRGTPSPRGRAWRKAVYRNVGFVASTDQAKAARAILKNRPYLDSSRVAIWGWSGGGSMTLNAIFRHPDLYQTGMSVAPVPDQHLYDTIYEERYMGLPDDNVEGYEQSSAINFAQNLKGNLLLVHGTGDDNVHYQGAERLINKLIEHNKPFTMFAYPNRSHSIKEGKNTSLHLFSMLTDYLEKSQAQ